MVDTSVAQTARPRSRALTILLWIATLLPALALFMNGLSKLTTTGEWDRLFASWGYPVWFSYVVGVVEMGGALLMLVPRLAFYGAAALAAVMLGAVVTLAEHPGSHFFRGRQVPMHLWTPLFYVVICAIVAAVRWKNAAGVLRKR